MKTPFPALYIQRESSPERGITFWPCVVRTLFPTSELAQIDIPSAMGRGRVFAKVVSYSSLASNQASALVKCAEAVADIIQTLPSTAEKSAVNETAGAVAG
jgi:hypothetical protein